ncbi:MAG: Rrf2 family transcriptional regulator [Thermodesulfobacteriota bacterium]
MRLTRAGEYAIRCALHLAGLKPGRLASRREIAQAMEIPYQFLGKIGPKLAEAGLIRIVQGAQGGYGLARASDQITLLDVVEAVEGRIFLNECLMYEDSCSRSRTCPVHRAWNRAGQALRAELARASLADLVQESLSTKGRP